MTNKEALYSNLGRLLRNISTDSDIIETYSAQLNEDRRESLFTLAENVDNNLINPLNEASGNNKLLQVDTNRSILINEFKVQFPGFPNARFNEILLIICLLNTLNNVLIEELNFENILDNPKYSLINFNSEKFGTNIFHLTDIQQNNNDFVFFNFEAIDEILSYFDNGDIQITPELVIHLVSQIGNETNLLESKFYTLIYHQTATNLSKSKGYIALNLIKSGHTYHFPYYYTRVISQTSVRPISVSNNYHQFKDTLTILSEYNDQKDILNKFLRLYHVIENFMFKSPIVKLEREQNTRPFSFRDFQRLHAKITKSEPETLKKLIDKVFLKIHKGTITFKTFIFQSFTNAQITSMDKALIDRLFAYLNIENEKKNEILKFDEINEDNFHKYFPKIIYAIRNSLVHNKESEFHLTHDTLLNHFEINDTVKNLIDFFLIPTIEEIIIFLITENENEIVWFSNPNLILWEN